MDGIVMGVDAGRGRRIQFTSEDKELIYVTDFLKMLSGGGIF